MIVHMHTHGIVHGIGLQSHTMPQGSCKSCAIEKSARLTFPKQQSLPRAETPILFSHNNVRGPMNHESFRKARYNVLFKDDYSGNRIVHCIRHKSDVLQKFKELCNSVHEQTKNRIQILRSDRGGEYVGVEFTSFLAKSGIRHKLTSPYCPEQNGSAERENCTLVECVRTMFHSKKLSL